jgi:hypothetical protein
LLGFGIFFGWRTGTWQVVRIWNFLVGGQGHGRLSGLGNIFRIFFHLGEKTQQVVSNAKNIFGTDAAGSLE